MSTPAMNPSWLIFALETNPGKDRGADAMVHDLFIKSDSDSPVTLTAKRLITAKNSTGAAYNKIEKISIDIPPNGEAKLADKLAVNNLFDLEFKDVEISYAGEVVAKYDDFKINNVPRAPLNLEKKSDPSNGIFNKDLLITGAKGGLFLIAARAMLKMNKNTVKKIVAVATAGALVYGGFVGIRAAYNSAADYFNLSPTNKYNNDMKASDQRIEADLKAMRALFINGRGYISANMQNDIEARKEAIRSVAFHLTSAKDRELVTSLENAQKHLQKMTPDDTYDTLTVPLSIVKSTFTATKSYWDSSVTLDTLKCREKLEVDDADAAARLLIEGATTVDHTNKTPRYTGELYQYMRDYLSPTDTVEYIRLNQNVVREIKARNAETYEYLLDKKAPWPMQAPTQNKTQSKVQQRAAMYAALPSNSANLPSIGTNNTPAIGLDLPKEGSGSSGDNMTPPKEGRDTNTPDGLSGKTTGPKINHIFGLS